MPIPLRAIPLIALAAMAGLGMAQAALPDRQRLAAATAEAREAARRSQALERAAASADGEAARTRALVEAAASRIQTAEAQITAAEARIALIERLRREQRVRLAGEQQPLVRLTAALQTMARRPPALALVQPGSMQEAIRVRSLLASTIPEVRARTADVRRELAVSAALRAEALTAVGALARGREALKSRSAELARIETEQRRRSQGLAASALVATDQALVLGEEARELSSELSRRAQAARTRQSLAALPAPVPRPPLPDGSDRPLPRPPGPSFMLPVQGRLVTGSGEISDSGVHSRGLSVEVASWSSVVAPAAGRVLHAGPYRSYRNIVIIDHGGGWTSLVTGLSERAVAAGMQVAQGSAIGRTGSNQPIVKVELRYRNQPVSITPLLFG